jgi:O-antigen/teichoic acid export membrane protein
MVDQAVSSGSNFLVTAIVAGLVSRSEFGAFSVALIAFQLGLGAVRATVGEPFLSMHSADDTEVRRRASADLLRAGFLTGALASLVMLVAAVAVGGLVFGPLVATACVFPFLGAQDSLRHVAVVDRPQLALVSDVAWLGLVIVLLVAAPDGASATWFALAWGLAGVGALVVALATMEVPLLGGNARRWLHEHREMAGAFLAEVASARTMSYVVILLLGPIAGLPAIGAVRAAQVYYGPLNTLFSGIYLVLVPDGAKQKDDSRRLVRFMLIASGVVTLAATVWVVIGLVLPDSIGTAVFGDTWAEAEEVLFPMGLAILAGSVATGAFAGLRSLGDARASLRARLCSLPPEATLTLAGAFVGGAVGYAYGFAAATSLIAALWWGFFLAAVRRREADDARDAGHRSGGSGRPGRVGPAASAVWFPPDPPLPQPISGRSR